MVLYTLSKKVNIETNANKSPSHAYNTLITISPSPLEGTESNADLKSVARRMHFKPVSDTFTDSDDVNSRCNVVLLHPDTKELLTISELPIILSYFASNSIEISSELNSSLLSSLQKTTDRNILMFISS